MSLHPTLARQIRVQFGDTPPPELADFFTAVSQTYEGFDQDHTLVERSLDISSQELGERIHQLREAQVQLETEKHGVELKVAERTAELQETQAQLEASIRALSFGFALINPKREIVIHNQVLEEVVGITIPKEVDQTKNSFQKLNDYFAPAINLADQIEQIAKQRIRIERQISLGANFYRLLILPILTAGEDIKTATSLGTVLVVEDITDAKAQERSRDEFFSIASHELRTPLTAIKGNSSMILTYFTEQIKDPQLHQMIADMHESSVRLIDIVNDFLSASRLEQGKMMFKAEPYDVNALAENVVHEYRQAASDGSVQLLFKGTPQNLTPVIGDSERVRQILTNLVSNAIKFTPKGSITLEVAAESKLIKINVTDTGRGIPTESQHLLFRKFQQASNNILTRDTTKGTGLGLYISQLLAENMKGRLYLAHTEIDKGTTFTLELPLVPAPTPLAPATSPATPPAATEAHEPATPENPKSE